jgi:predicted enzyme related to lactoylglutathione lyase
MVPTLSHVTVYVLDQDAALAFWTEKVGWRLHTDQEMNGLRWLTVVAPEGGPQLILLEPEMSGASAGDARLLRELIARGALGTGVLHASDCRAAYERMSAAGVTFLAPPHEVPYGIEATFRDESGNWFSLNQWPDEAEAALRAGDVDEPAAQ